VTGPLRAADAAVRAWLAGVIGDVPLTDGPPPDIPSTDIPSAGRAAGGSSDATDPAPVSLHLYEVAAERPLADARVPRTFRLRYLLTGPDGPGTLDLLDAVLADRIAAEGAARVAGAADLVVEPATAALLAARGVAPRPALVVETTARLAPPAATAPLVTQPAVVTPAFLRPVRGRVVGPGGIGLGAVSVALAGSDRWERTGPDGAFNLAAPVDGTGRTRVRVAAKGREFTADLEPAGDEILIHCDPRET
jgi:hypothetical protein